MTELELIYFEDLEEEDFLKVQRFLNMPFEEKKQITPVWAIGEYAHLALDPILEMEPENYILVYISPKQLIENADRLMLPTNELFTGDLNDYRYASTLELWTKGKPVDPPSISFLNNSKKTITINDGRHRSILSYYLGYEKIPVIINLADLQSLAQFVTND